MKAVIVDDEQDCRASLLQFITEHLPNVQVVGLANSVATGIENIELHQPDIVFLDIQLGDGTGFSLLKQLDGRINFHLIFTTAYDEFALKAFRFSAIDYLLKPIDPQELKEAVMKVAPKEKIENFIRTEFLSHALEEKQITKIVIPGVENYQIVNISDIVRCESDSNYTTIYLVSGERITTSKTLKEYDQLLPTPLFFRSHKSHLINTNYINRVAKFRTGGDEIELKNGHKVGLSRLKRKDLLSLLEVKG